MLLVAVSSTKIKDGIEDSRRNGCVLLTIGSDTSNRRALTACLIDGLWLRSSCVHHSPTTKTHSICPVSNSPFSRGCAASSIAPCLYSCLRKTGCRPQATSRTTPKLYMSDSVLNHTPGPCSPSFQRADLFCVPLSHVK